MNQPGQPHVVALTVAPDGFVYAGEIKIARYHPERQTLEFHDKDRRRCAKLGRTAVEVPLAEVARLAEAKR